MTDTVSNLDNPDLTAPPSPAPTASPDPGNRRPSRFLTGLVAGALVGGLSGAAVGGGIVASTNSNSNSDQQPPVTADVVAEGTSPTAVNSGTINPIAALVTRVRPSVVAIHDSIAQTDIFGRTVEGQAAGTGFVLSADGYIVTNNHVIDQADSITVNFSDQTTADATVVAADPASDLAVLKVDRTDLVPLPLGSSGDLQVGDQLVAIGNALDLSGEPTVTTGIVSATGRSLIEPNGIQLANLIQTDTAINPGNSGGPLLDISGRVVGINTAIAGQAQNVGFAISIDPAKVVIDQLQAGTVPDHALLGVVTRIGPEGTGAEIIEVSPDSAAEKADLHVGDVITDVDGATVTTPDDLGAAIISHRPGDTVDLTYQRGNATEHASIELGARPATSS